MAFGVAVGAGLYLAAVAGWELLVVGAASGGAGGLAPGGPRPYGYEGLGELFVFLFFGVVAVAGSYFVQTEDLRWEAVALGVPVGLLAAAILVVNNVRDVDTDRRAGKRTLAVKLGRERARVLFVAMVVVAFLIPVLLVPALSAWLLLPLAALPLVPPLVHTVQHSKPTDPRSTKRSPRRGACSPSTRCCLPGACCSRERARRANRPQTLNPAEGAVRDRRTAWSRPRAAAAPPRGTRRDRGLRRSRTLSSPMTACRSSAPRPRSREVAGAGPRRCAPPRRSHASTCMRARRTGRLPRRAGTPCP